MPLVIFILRMTGPGTCVIGSLIPSHGSVAGRRKPKQGWEPLGRENANKFRLTLDSAPPFGSDRKSERYNFRFRNFRFRNFRFERCTGMDTVQPTIEPAASSRRGWAIFGILLVGLSLAFLRVHRVPKDEKQDCRCELWIRLR